MSQTFQTETSDPRIKNNVESAPIAISGWPTSSNSGSDLTYEADTADDYDNSSVEEFPTPVKWNMQIRDLGCEEYRLTEPLFILIEEWPDDEGVIARWPEVRAIGQGDTEVEAINNLKLAILDLYDELTEDEDALGDYLKSWLRIVKQVIVKE
ncbi:MAG: hypothetical protein KDE54_00470 [Caldilineaceae bacterium]|nr:hypothetical protein [Caldilineaceae bacterium]MCB0143835.1 hypothetical protein [Caldilineaceae bacterium]